MDNLTLDSLSCFTPSFSSSAWLRPVCEFLWSRWRRVPSLMSVWTSSGNRPSPFYDSKLTNGTVLLDWRRTRVLCLISLIRAGESVSFCLWDQEELFMQEMNRWVYQIHSYTLIFNVLTYRKFSLLHFVLSVALGCHFFCKCLSCSMHWLAFGFRNKSSLVSSAFASESTTSVFSSPKSSSSWWTKLLCVFKKKKGVISKTTFRTQLWLGEVAAQPMDHAPVLISQVNTTIKVSYYHN